MSRRVVKVGGSLLGNPATADYLRSWLNRHSSEQNILVVGGGSLANCIRTWDAKLELQASFTHQTCVELMSITARLLNQLVPELPIRNEIDESDSSGDYFLDVARMLQAQDVLERSWNVTSDSIAAWIAGEIGAAEIVLLKSVTPSNRRISSWCRDHLVDQHFQSYADRIARVVMVNLADPNFSEVIAE